MFDLQRNPISGAHRTCRLALIALAATGCKRLPDTVPYQAELQEKEGSGSSRVAELAGAELLRDGTTLGRLKVGDTSSVLNATWSGPKAGLRANLNGTYAVRHQGLCGHFELAAEGPPENWKALTDGVVASSIAKRGFLSIYLSVKLAPSHAVYVDWGAVTGTLRIGTLTVAPKQKVVDVTLAGCAADPVVTLDGTPLGTLPRTATASLVTLEPKVCHVLAPVAYGKGPGAAKPPVYFAATPVVAVPERPFHVLEPAPETLEIHSDGVTSTELVRAPCR